MDACDGLKIASSMSFGMLPLFNDDLSTSSCKDAFSVDLARIRFIHQCINGRATHPCTIFASADHATLHQALRRPIKIVR